MMTFSTRPAQASFTRRISSSTWEYRPSFTQPRFITMSISSTPSATAAAASKHLAAVVEYPLGKPMTVQMGSRPAANSTACLP